MHKVQVRSRVGRLGKSTKLKVYWVLFDGAAATAGQCCCGMVIKVSEKSLFLLWMGCGMVANTGAELLALWGLLLFAHSKNFNSLRIYGDSKIIVDWANDKGSLHVAILELWGERLRSLMSYLSQLSFSHVYRCFNNQTDQLSKRAVGAEKGIFHFEEFEDFVKIDEASFKGY